MAGSERDRFFRSQIAELLNYLRAESEMRKMAMKNHFIVLGCFLLLAMLGFALDVGITAMLLSHS